MLQDYQPCSEDDSIAPAGEDPSKHEPRNDGHELWLAMQSAYLEYRRASDAVENVNRSFDESSTIYPFGLTIFYGQQMTAFERYMEARMAFVESRLDEGARPGGSHIPPSHDPKDSGVGSRLFGNQREILNILAFVLLCTTAFSLVRLQRHVRDLETIRDEQRVALSQTREGIQLLARKLDASLASQNSATQPVEHNPRVPDNHLVAAASATAGQKPREQVKSPRPPAQIQKTAGSTGDSFWLTPSRQFKRVGPVDISVRSMDVQRKNVSLFVVSDRATLNVQVRPNQPVWIKSGDRGQLLGIVIDRIASNRLDGRLLRPPQEKRETKISRLKPILPAGP